MREIHHQLGYVYNARGDHQMALSFYGKALEIRQRNASSMEYHRDITVNSSSMGEVQREMRNYSIALSFYEKNSSD